MAYRSPNWLSSHLEQWLGRSTLDTGSQAVEELDASLGTTVGNKRNDNQDCAVLFRIETSSRVPITGAILCDGIGGLRDGGVCSRIAVAAFVSTVWRHRFLSLSDILQRAIEAANSAVFDQYREEGGSTLASFLVRGNEPPITANVGDSRVYLHQSHELLQLSNDDTIKNEIEKLGSISKRASAFGNQLTQFIGMGKDLEIRTEPIVAEAPPAGGLRRILLTTDGIHSLNADIFKEIVNCAPTTLDVVRRLTTLSRWGKITDNATIACCNIKTDLILGAFDSFTIWDCFSSREFLFEFIEQGKKDRSRYPKDGKKKASKPRDPVAQNSEMKLSERLSAKKENELELEIIEEKHNTPPPDQPPGSIHVSQ